MGEGRLCWTLRRPFFYGTIMLFVCMIAYGVHFMDIFDGAFARNGDFNLFFAYLFWSIPGLILMVIISVANADSWGLPKVASLFRFLFEDLVSPIYAVFQLIFGFFIQKMGRDVDWAGLIWDLVWTIICVGFIVWGVLTQI